MPDLEEISDCPPIHAEIISNNLITLDKEVRERYNLRQGAKFIFKITHVMSRPKE